MPPDNLRGNCQVICGFHIMMEGDLMGDLSGDDMWVRSNEGGKFVR